MMSENNDKDAIIKEIDMQNDATSTRMMRSDSTSSNSSQRSYSQRFKLNASHAYLVPDERLLQLKDRKLLMDVMYEDLLNVSWLLGITPKSMNIVDKASYCARSFACVPCHVISRGFTLITCFISDWCPGAVSRFTHEHPTEDLLSYIRTNVENRKLIAPYVAAAVYHAMLIRRSSFLYSADQESLILEKVELVLQEGRDAGVNVDDIMKNMNQKLVDQHFMSLKSEGMSR